MSKYTKLLQVSKETYRQLLERDGGCIFCQRGYHMHPKYPTVIDVQIIDAMHYIPKSSLGLGILENLIAGCRYHHSLMDNGKHGLREEMLKICQGHLKSLYHDWKKENLIYKKY